MSPHSTRRSARVRILASAGLSLLAISLLAACGAEDTATGQERTTTITVPSTSEAVAPITTTLPPITATETVDTGRGASPTTRPVAEADDCAPNIGASAQVSNDITRISPPGPGQQWQAANAGGTRCPGLSYVYLVGPGGGPTEPKQLLIYHNGYFLGTGIRCNVRYQEVSTSGPDSIDVIYRYDVPDEPTQSPLGEADVTFRWNGSRVVMDGSLPYAITKGQC